MSNRKISEFTKINVINDNAIFLMDQAGTTCTAQVSTVVTKVADKLSDPTNPVQFIPKPASVDDKQVLTYNTSTSTWVASSLNNISTESTVDDTSVSSGLTSYVLKNADANKILICNNTSPLTASVPYNTFNVGTEIVLMQNSGLVTLSAGSGVTIKSNGNKYKTNGVNASVLLVKIQTNTWMLGGNTAL